LCEGFGGGGITVVPCANALWLKVVADTPKNTANPAILMDRENKAPRIKSPLAQKL
jgi:hypothetical protein